jgi:hypothetical protein
MTTAIASPPWQDPRRTLSWMRRVAALPRTGVISSCGSCPLGVAAALLLILAAGGVPLGGDSSSTTANGLL